MVPLHAGHFSTLHLLASLSGKNLRLKALRQFSRRPLRCGGRVPRKISNARFRDMIVTFHEGITVMKKRRDEQ
jgi:hypothetical protein